MRAATISGGAHAPGQEKQVLEFEYSAGYTFAATGAGGTRDAAGAGGGAALPADDAVAHVTRSGLFLFALEHLQVDALSLLLLPDAGEYPGDIDPHSRGGIRARQHALEHRGDPRDLAGFEVEIGEVPIERPVVRLVLQQHLNLLVGTEVVALALQKLD